MYDASISDNRCLTEQVPGGGRLQQVRLVGHSVRSSVFGNGHELNTRCFLRHYCRLQYLLEWRIPVFGTILTLMNSERRRRSQFLFCQGPRAGTSGGNMSRSTYIVKTSQTFL